MHIAPEYCLYQRFKHSLNIDYYPGDKFEKGYGVQKGVHQLDLTDLTQSDDTFDYIICNHILEHIPDDSKAMFEMFRVLKNGGKAFIMVPVNQSLNETYEDFSIVDPAERIKQFGQWDHVRFYSMDIMKRLEIQGFQVNAVRYSDKFSKENHHKYGLCDDYIFVASKLP